MKKVILIIMDGYGCSSDVFGNAILAANKPNIDALVANFPVSHLKCSGLSVGLPEGQMGNSEVGHLNIGAGRIVYQELTRISKSIKDNDFFKNPVLLKAIRNAHEHNSAVHLMGLVSDGGVHSFDTHYKALIDLMKKENFDRVFVHCFMDGRDTLPTSGAKYIQDLEKYMEDQGVGRVASVSGRYYAMDRDKHYERIQLAYDAMVLGKGSTALYGAQAVRNSYNQGITDEFIMPTVIVENNKPIATVNTNDSVIFFNFRPDRAREMTKAFIEDDFSGFKREKTVDVKFITMTSYDKSFTNVEVAFKPNLLKNTLGEYISLQGKKQLRISETEKYAHVTYFLNGGIEKAYENEDRVLIPSPRVDTYDMKPEMSAYEVTERLNEEIKKDIYDLIVVNYANCDMVAHTGVFDAAVKAVECVDDCVGQVYQQASSVGYSMIVTADHGNAEMMRKGEDTYTAHSTNDVPCIVIDQNVDQIKDGQLSDLAPTILQIINIAQPIEMTGNSLIK